ncbi:MAG: hypothetical protein SYR96_10445 [Actinomycetota bacterium]|nr:hypothetical protein [Actinomycetota bacterium]
MSAVMRAVRRTAALVFVLPVLAFGPAALAAEDEDLKNLSTPVVLADGADLALADTTVPGLPIGEKDAEYPAYYTARAGAVWGADRVVAAEQVLTDVKWGDNLMSHQFSARRNQPIRVEVNLFANNPATYGQMYGYPMVSLEETRRDEVFGTLGIAEPINPMVYTPDATLTILKADATGQYTQIVVSTRAMVAEVNASGKVIYGFNWGRSGGVSSPTAGSYRLVLTIGGSSVVTLIEALTGDSEVLFPPAPITDGKTSMLDIVIGTRN